MPGLIDAQAHLSIIGNRVALLLTETALSRGWRSFILQTFSFSNKLVTA
jgi:hypothetical protein